MIVIDATDTGGLIGWTHLPHRLGSEATTTTLNIVIPLESLIPQVVDNLYSRR